MLTNDIKAATKMKSAFSFLILLLVFTGCKKSSMSDMKEYASWIEDEDYQDGDEC